MIYLNKLRTDVKNSGDYVNDPHLKDADLNLWLNQAFSRIWVRVVSQGDGFFAKDVLLNLQYDEDLKKYYAVLPPDYFSLEDVYFKRGTETYQMERAPDLKDIRNREYQPTDQLKFFYTPQAPLLLESAPEGENAGTGYDFILAEFWRYFLIDYAIKRSRMKQDDPIQEIDLETVTYYNDILSAARNKNNHFPSRPSRYRAGYSMAFGENYLYAYYPLGKKLYLV